MFIFKKIVSRFFFPVSLSLEITLIGVLLLWFTKRQKSGKVLVSLGLLLMILFSNSVIADFLLSPLERKYDPYTVQLSNERGTPAESDPIKFIVVLGGGHTSDPTLPITSQISDSSLVRLIEGIRMYRKYVGSKLILSGGSGFDSIPNAKVMARVAKALGIDEKDIILEVDSKDTKDEAKFLKPIVGADPFLLVTSASHMLRSIAMFKKLGMNPIPAPTEHHVKENQGLNPGTFFPGAFNLYKSERAVYEYLGIVWAKLRGLI